MKNQHLFLICFILVSVFGIGQVALAQDKIPVLVSVLPQQYFAERIGGDRITVEVLVKPGKSPATYAPTPAQIRLLVSAKIYFRVGVPFENGFMKKIKALSPDTKIIDTRNNVTLRYMTEDHHHDDHDRRHDEDQNKQGKDPHIWMNPRLVKIQAKTMHQALCEADPLGTNIFTDNLADFLKDLDELDETLTRMLAPVKGENVFVFHPSFGYFTDAYGLYQMAIESEGKAPKGKALSAMIRKIKEKKGRVVFVQIQFDTHAAQKLALAVKGSVFPMDPLAYDYLENMLSMGKAIAESLK